MLFLLKILNRLGCIKFFNFNTQLVINGKKFNLPISGGIGFGNIPMSEIWMVKCLDLLLQIKKGTFIDIGANIGQSLLKVKSVDSQINYIGFEPNPKCVSYIEEIIKENNFLSTQIVPTGVSNENGILKLNLFHNNATDISASLIDNFQNDNTVYQKYIVVSDQASISRILPDDICIVKIDVEGYEWFVVQALNEVLLKQRPFVLIEILPVYSESNRKRYEPQMKLEKYFIDMNYQFMRIVKDAEDNFLSLEIIEKIDVHGDTTKCEYLITPHEHIKRICSIFKT